MENKNQTNRTNFLKKKIDNLISDKKLSLEKIENLEKLNL